MFRLAHLSDPHLGPLPNPTLMQLASKRVLGYVNWRRNRKGTLTGDILDNLLQDLHAQDPDHIAVSGDLVNLALPAEINNAGRWLESVGPAKAVSVVPGNHDAYVPRSRLRAEKKWQPYMSGDEDTIASSRFPYLRVRGKIALIGVNSAEATLPLMATGYFRDKQSRNLSDILDLCSSQGLFRIVMIHHPPCHGATHWHKRLIGASRFRSVIKTHGAELVLHGHTHRPTKMAIPGPNGEVPVICTASASQAPGGQKTAARYNLFRISGESGNWRCELTERGYQNSADHIETISQQSIAIPGAIPDEPGGPQDRNQKSAGMNQT